jgi:hypothetical protein
MNRERFKPGANWAQIGRILGSAPAAARNRDRQRRWRDHSSAEGEVSNSFTPNGDGLSEVSIVEIEKGRPKLLKIVNPGARWAPDFDHLQLPAISQQTRRRARKPNPGTARLSLVLAAPSTVPRRWRFCLTAFPCPPRVEPDSGGGVSCRADACWGSNAENISACAGDARIHRPQR